MSDSTHHSSSSSSGVGSAAGDSHVCSTSDLPRPVQVYPSLLSVDEQKPQSFPFGIISLPATGVFFATPLSYASVNQSPILPGHTLVMPRSNRRRVRDLPPAELSDLWLTAQHVANVLETNFKAEAITFAIQDGKEAGQKIPCVHIHIVPRHPHDLKRKDDIYDLIERNIPADARSSHPNPQAGTPEDEPATSTIVHDAERGAAVAARKQDHIAKAAQASNGQLHEALDDEKRIIRSRAEQAVEARQFATWMKEAGLPPFLRESTVPLQK